MSDHDLNRIAPAPPRPHTGDACRHMMEAALVARERFCCACWRAAQEVGEPGEEASTREVLRAALQVLEDAARNERESLGPAPERPTPVPVPEKVAGFLYKPDGDSPSCS